MAAIGIMLIIQRGGVFSWVIGATGILLLLENFFLPKPINPRNTLVSVAILAITWIATYGLIIGVWETGEVAELQIKVKGEEHNVRVWLAEIDESIGIYYDADPHIAESLLSDPRLKLIRGDKLIEFSNVEIIPVASAPNEKVNQLFEQWEAKYGSRNLATPIYSFMFGRNRNRIGLMLTLNE